MNEGIVDLGGGLELADVHQLHQESLLVFGEFLMLASSRPLLSQLDKDRPRSILNTLDKGLSEDLFGLPLLDGCSYKGSQLEAVNSVTKLWQRYWRRDSMKGLIFGERCLKKSLFFLRLASKKISLVSRKSAVLGLASLCLRKCFSMSLVISSSLLALLVMQYSATLRICSCLSSRFSSAF